jgi:hypothetical protein
MTTTITPSLGAAPLFTQGGTGAAPGYSAIDRRRADSPGLQAGVMGATDFKVVQRGAGANMSIDVTMTAGGSALVQGGWVAGQGLYTVPVHGSTINEVVAAAHATLPRIDSVYLRVYDHQHDFFGLNRAEIVLFTGTATGGATLDNRSGAIPVTGSVLLLGDVLVPAASSSVITANIRDRRAWARGANYFYERVSGDYASAAGALADIDATNMKRRIECSGAPIVVTLDGAIFPAGGPIAISMRLDIDGTVFRDKPRHAVASQYVAGTWVWTLPSIAAGSHLFTMRWSNGSGVAMSMIASGTNYTNFSIAEQVRQNADNT